MSAHSHTFASGIKLAIPVILGYLPVGFTFGILAVQAGFTPLEAGLMSYFVYAGSAQLITTGLVLAGASIPSIIVTTFVVNLRHALMSASLVPYAAKWSKLRQAWFCFELTDETYALNLSRFMKVGVHHNETLGINMFSHLGWVAGSVSGALLGDIIGDTKKFGLDFALVGMFIALLTPHLPLPRKALAVLAGASLSVIFLLVGIGQWSTLLATILGAAIAAFAPMPAKKNQPYTAPAVQRGNNG